MRKTDLQASYMMILGLFCLLLTSCGFVYEGEGDCPQRTSEDRLRLLADVNLEYTDVFHQEIKSIWLYAFDEEGLFQWGDYVDATEILEDEEGIHYIDLSAFPAGKYNLIIWGGLGPEASFTVPTLTPGVSRLEELTCTLTRKTRAEQLDIVDTELTPLFHGMTNLDLPQERTRGVRNYDVHLTKDTNKITIVLEEVNGKEINLDDYEFVIEANNGHLNYDNTLLNDQTRFVYGAWSQQYSAEEYDVNDDFAESREGNIHTRTSSVEAELTISRLVDEELENRPTLTITHKTSGEQVLSIPIIDYALKVRNNYENVTDNQDFLDRQDEYQMTFFLSNGTWLNSVIYINSWRIVLNVKDLH
jgi:hypothetical protein